MRKPIQIELRKKIESKEGAMLSPIKNLSNLSETQLYFVVCVMCLFEILFYLKFNRHQIVCQKLKAIFALSDADRL